MPIFETYQHILQLDIENDEQRRRMAFIWAVREQEALWLQFDARFVGCVEQGGFDSQIFREMLTAYKVLRGRFGQIFGGDANVGNRNTFIGHLQGSANNLQEGAADNNTAIWHQLGVDLSGDDRFIQNDAANVGWTWPSATLKALWFYAPNLIPMYDRYVATAIRNSFSNANLPNDFLCCFYQLMQQNLHFINGAKVIWGSNYPYDIRILDKYLWLMGHPNKSNILQNFKMACQRLA